MPLLFQKCPPLLIWIWILLFFWSISCKMLIREILDALFRDHPAKQATSLLLRIQSKRGDKMGQDTIQTIRDAEEKADQIERQAEAECAALLAQARSQAKEETDKRRVAKARADNQQALHQAREKARQNAGTGIGQRRIRNPGKCRQTPLPKKKKPSG